MPDAREGLEQEYNPPARAPPLACSCFVALSPRPNHVSFSSRIAQECRARISQLEAQALALTSENNRLSCAGDAASAAAAAATERRKGEALMRSAEAEFIELQDQLKMVEKDRDDARKEAATARVESGRVRGELMEAGSRIEENEARLKEKKIEVKREHRTQGAGSRRLGDVFLRRLGVRACGV